MPDRYTPREMLAKLVGFDTVSSKSNLPLIDFVEDYLTGWGVECFRYEDPEEPKAALFCNVGPWVEGGVVLSGHTDVVPVEGQAWGTDPFVLTEKDGKLYGRGTTDMKGFDALALAIVPEALEAGLKRPLQIALSFDEELGCRGAPPMIAKMREVLPMASAVIVGEPTSWGVVSAHKGGVGFTTHVTGYEVHSSICHKGVSAVMTGAELVHWLAARMAENRAAAPKSEEAAMFDPPWTTLHAGTFHGGTAGNITALKASFTTDIRVTPPDDAETWARAYVEECRRLEAEIRKVRPEASIDPVPRATVPPCRQEKDGAAEALARALTGDNTPRAVAYITEAGQFQDGGYSAVVCGPGDIGVAHQPDEYLEISQLDEGEAFMRRLVARLAS